MFWKKRAKEIYKDPLEKIAGAEGKRRDILAIIKYLPDGILFFDEKSRVSLINPRAEKILKINKDDVLGKQILGLSRFLNFKPLISLLGGGIKKVSKREVKINEDFIIQISSLSMRVEKEKIGSLVILHDVSKEKLVERMKTEFVTVAAHQLRTPSSAVKWSAKMLLDGDLGKLSGEQKKALERIYQTNNRMIKLINDLLNVAEIEEGRYLSKLALLDIKEVIQPLIDNYKDRAVQKKIKFDFEIPEELPKLMLDREKIKIALEVIFDNALRYTFSGGKVEGQVQLIKEKGVEKLKFQVADTGLGIPKNQQGKIFTKFFRADNIMKIDTEGSGLGLYMAKNIIEAHEGEIWFESQEDKGSVFYFTLPVKEKFSQFLGEEFY